MRERILEMLKKHQGEYLSGEEISQILKVSRTAIWKHIGILREQGYQIESVSKLGYKLEAVPDKMLPREVVNGLQTKFLGQKVIYFEQIDSTNNEAKKLADQNGQEGTMVIAEAQTGGKGRLGRSWESPMGKGLWFSLILRPQISPAEAGQLTLLAAVAITEMLRAEYNLQAGIKWPNDILCNGKKLCGILTEMNAEADAVNYLVLGIGINVNFKASDFPRELRGSATSLSMELGQEVNRLKLLQNILQDLEVLYSNKLHQGFKSIIQSWKKYNVTLGYQVNITNWQQQFTGKAIDIDPSGGLVVELPDNSTRTFYSGDVTLKRST